MTEMTTSQSYRAEVEVRAGKRVMVVTRTTTTTPRSKRGKEWSKQERTTRTTVLPIEEAERMVTAMIEAAMIVAVSPDELVVRDEPSISLCTADKAELAVFYSPAEAREAAHNHYSDRFPLVLLRKDDMYFVERIGVDA